MRKIIISAFLFLASALTLNAQSTSELVVLSQSDDALGSARSAAMGGAFTALGADPSSMSINPAGLGLYRSSDLSITGYMLKRNIRSSAERLVTGGLVDLNLPSRENSFSTGNYFGVADFSFIYNIINRPQAKLSNLTLGVGFSQQANFAQRAETSSPYTRSSIADMFGAQLFGVNPSVFADGDNHYGYGALPVSSWGAVGAINSGLIFDNDMVNVGGVDYVRYGPYYYDNTSGEMVGSLVTGDIVKPSQLVTSRGSLRDFNLALGGTLKEKFSVGFTLNITSFSNNTTKQYTEITPSENLGDLVRLDYFESLYMSGVGIGAKLGVIYRPFKGLRIGAAVHSPSIISVSENFYTRNENEFLGYQFFSSDSPEYRNEYKVRTAPKANVGVSYTFGKIGILSVDYEHTWYDCMDVKGIEYLPGETTFRDEFKALYRPSGVIRAGAELNVGGGFMLRGGYSRKGNNLAYLGDNKEKYNITTSFSGGVGYRGRRSYIDFAYVKSTYKMMPVNFYSYTLSIPNGNDYIVETYASDAVYGRKVSDHYCLLTFGLKF